MTKTFLSISSLCLALLLPACGGGGGDSAPPAPPTFDLTGQWTISETVLSATSVCVGEIGTMESYTLQATQTGNSLTVVTPLGTFTGTVGGTQVQWTGSYSAQGGGVTTFTSMGTASTADSVSGTTNWSWTDGVDSCTGQNEVTGSRTVPAMLAHEIVLVHAVPTDDRPIAILAGPTGLPQEDAEFIGLLEEDGTTELRLPPGTYDLFFVMAPDGGEADPFSQPAVARLQRVKVLPGQGQLLVVEAKW